MNVNFNVEWILKAAAAVVLILAAFGKSLLALGAATGPAVGCGSHDAALCLGLGLWIAAPLIGGLVKPKS